MDSPNALLLPILTAAAPDASPKKVLEMLQEAADGAGGCDGAATITPALVGKLLFYGHGTIATQLLGAMLGNHAPFFAQLAEEYPTNFDFAGLGVVNAIRGYLWRFRLPGEAAQIERVIQGFARAYYAQQQQQDTPASSIVATTTPSGSIVPTQIPKSIAAEAVGWYVVQPRDVETGEVCCAHCGSTETTVKACTGCNIIHFCRKCRYTASKRGHAVVGSCGYGRACIAARAHVGHGVFTTGDDTLIGKIEYAPGNTHGLVTADVQQQASAWPKGRVPFANEDSVFVLAYSIIMLTTNLHNGNVKEKMKLHQFLLQNRGINGGADGKEGNFPGDFLASIYKEVGSKAVQVMTA